MSLVDFKEFLSYKKEIDTEIKMLSSSEIRLKLLVELLKGPLNMKKINEITLLSYSSISNNVHKLMDFGYIKKKDTEFYITNKGIIQLMNVLDFNESILTINEFSDFWHNHNVKPLCMEELREIPVLEGAKIVESVSVDIYKTHNELKRLLQNSKSLKLIFPYLHPEYPKLIRDLLGDGAKLEILLPLDILDNFVRGIGLNTVREGILRGNLSIKYLTENVQIALSLSDDFVSIGLYRNDGSYDHNRLLVSENSQTIAWGGKIFGHYSRQASRFNLKSLEREIA